MLFKYFAICVSSYLLQSINAQCIAAYNGLADNLAWQSGNALAWEAASAPWSASPCAGPSAYSGLPYGSNFALNEWGAGYSPSNLAASYGGGLAVTSTSPIAPTGVSMTSENAYEGPLAISGAIPFLGAVALEGALPTGGAGAVSYGSGNGNIAMLNEDYAGYAGPMGYAGINGPAYGYNGLGPAFEGYNGLAGPLALEAGLAGPGYGYNLNSGRFGGYGCGAVY